MDVILYFAVLILMGVARISATKDVADSVGIVEAGEPMTASIELPIASNLELKRDPEAFTLILVELGLVNVNGAYRN